MEIGNDFHRRGFTLAEVMMVLSVMGLVFLLAWPAFRLYTQEIRRRVETQQLVQQLQAARQKSVLTGTKQTVAGAVFYPDGSADSFFTQEVHVDETGRIRVFVD